MSQFRSQYRIDATLDVLRRFSRRETLFDYQSSPINPGGRVCARVANSLARSNFQFTLPNVSRMGCIGSSHARNEGGGESISRIGFLVTFLVIASIVSRVLFEVLPLS